jgi:NADH-quinone oxidoreductase subunit N
MIYLVGLIAAITCTFGNLAAYGQTNIKRLLAYSTIAHAGYMMLPVTAALAFWGEGLQAQATEAIASLLFYVGVYFFMNLGAFAIVAFLRNEMRSEEIADYGGLLKSSPGVVICFSIILFSLVGLPPLAGFTGKFLIFASLADAGLYTLLVIGGLNTVLSLFYYLRIIKVMTIEPEPEDRVPVSFSLVSLPGAYVVLVTVPVVVLFLWSDLLLGWSKVAVASLW